MFDNDNQETYLGSQYVSRDSIEAADDPTAGPWEFGGVACAAGDILRTNDGKPVLLTAEELAQAEYAKPSEKLTVDHPEYDGGSPPVESIVGSNSMRYSSDGEAIVYAAETHDEDIAAGVHSDSFDVSIHAGFELGEQDPETGAYIARNIVFADLSVVGVGDSDSNTVEWGGRQEVAAWAHGGGLEAALSDDGGGDAADGSPSADGVGPAETQSLVSSAVNGTLRALGFDTGAADTPAELTADESGTPESTDDSQDNMTDRDDNIEFITANSDFDEEVLAGMDDEQVEQTRDLVDDEDATENEGEPEADADDAGTDNDGQQLADMTVGELGDALQQQGFVTEDEMAEAAAEQDKADMVDEIVAASPEYGDDDREDLMASPESVVENIHEKETTIAAAPAPGVGGARSVAEASVGDTDEHDLDDYGTGVAE